MRRKDEEMGDAGADRAPLASQLLTVEQASLYVGVRRSHFLEHVRPQLSAEYDVAAPGKRAAPRFLRGDLDAWIQTRRRERAS